MDLYLQDKPNHQNIEFSLNNKISKEDQVRLVYQVFVYRLNFVVNAVSNLCDSTHIGDSKFRLAEFPIGILLRSALLDCLWITACTEHREYISILAAESLARLSADRFVPPALRQEYKNVHEFLNVDNFNLKKTSTAANLATIFNDHPIVANTYNLYQYYSKYDHFSLIPFMDQQQNDNKVKKIHDGTVSILHGLFFLYEHFESSESNYKKYQQPLNYITTDTSGKTN